MIHQKYLNNPWAPILLALCLGATSSGCKKKQPTPSKEQTTVQPETTENLGVTLNFKPDEAQKAAISALVASLDRKALRFPNKDTNEPNNARLFTYIAASNDDPEVISGALSAMYNAYSSHSKKKAEPDADFVAVVGKHLASEDPKILTRALLAARTGIAGKDGSPDLINNVLKVADRYPTGAGRYAVIDALRVVSLNNRSERLMQVLTESLKDPEPYVLSYALQALYRSSRSIQDTNAVKARTLELSQHENPGVRGRAIELLGSLGRGDQAVLDRVLAALTDSDPYVRSEACDSIARLRHVPAIHRLMPLVDDKEKNRYEIADWTMLDGRPGRLHHDGSAWSHVYDAAMNAVRGLSNGDIKFERIDPKQIDEGLAANAKATKAWYAKEKSKLPAFTSTLQTSVDTPASGTAPATTGQQPAASPAKPATGTSPGTGTLLPKPPTGALPGAAPPKPAVPAAPAAPNPAPVAPKPPAPAAPGHEGHAH